MNTYRYQPEGLVSLETEGKTIVADSFLAVEGKVRSLDLHLDRFSRGIALKTPELSPLVPGFFEQVRKQIPKQGAWFPRIEAQLLEEPALLLKVRPAPEIFETATLWTYQEPDPRLDLTVKGPELALGQTLREQAQFHGADEAILTDNNGFISEGSLSSLVWFKDGYLVAPGNEIPWLESITRTEIFQVAKKLSIPTRFELAKPEDLVGLEVWLLSSLQGIRVVTNWLGVSFDFKQSDLKARFEAELALMEQGLV